METSQQKIVTHIRSVGDVVSGTKFQGMDDPNGLLAFSDVKLSAYCHNPFLHGQDTPAQLIGVADGKVVARRNLMSNQIVVDGNPVNCKIGDSLFVDPEYRGTLYALELFSAAYGLPGGDLFLSCGLSPAAQKLNRLLRHIVFPLPQFVFSRSSASLFRGRRMKGLVPFLSAILDKTVWPFVLRRFERRTMRAINGLVLKEENVCDKEFLAAACQLIGTDRHRFRQDATPEWLQWILSEDFIEKPRKMLFGVYSCDRLIGFVAARCSGDGVWGKLLEWQIEDQHRDMTVRILVAVAQRMFKCVTNVVVAVDGNETDMVEQLAGLSKWRMGDQMATVGLGPKSSMRRCPGIKDPLNWRIRPGMGDAAFW